jgi:hypothetical protein
MPFIYALAIIGGFTVFCAFGFVLLVWQRTRQIQASRKPVTVSPDAMQHIESKSFSRDEVFRGVNKSVN